MQTSQSLLADYVKNGSEGAFRELVTAYIDFVFATALRVVGGDRPLAEDVSQTVFTDLARKAVVLPRDVKLGGWLHRHTCFVGRKALRRERRRIVRERQAMELTTIEDYTQENLGQLSTILDETINGLGKEDRNAIILRFFEQLDYRALGAALGSTEDAARMRVSRALEKMGGMLRRRGIAMSVAGLSFVLSTKVTAAAAPAGLALKVSTIALSQSLKGWAALSFLKEACLTRLNLGIAGGATAVAAALLLFIPARHGQATLELRKEVSKPADFAGIESAEDERATGPAVPESPAEQAGMVSPTAGPTTRAPGPKAVPAVSQPVAAVTFPKTNGLPSQPSTATETPAAQVAGAEPSAGAIVPARTAPYGINISIFPNRPYGQQPIYGQPAAQPNAPDITAAAQRVAVAANTNGTAKVILPPGSAAYPGGVQAGAAVPSQGSQMGNLPSTASLRMTRSNNQKNRQHPQ